LHPGGGCGFSRHGTYSRKSPPGIRIARYYCRQGQTTFSLLPDFLASRLPGTLAEVQQVVEEVEQARSVWAAVDALQLQASLLSAARWVRRRTLPVWAALSALCGMAPLLAGVEPTILSLRPVLGAEDVLVRLRQLGAEHLASLPPPVGFGPHRRPLSRRRHRHQHDMGPAPPRPRG
jgi:hypothetical protein